MNYLYSSASSASDNPDEALLALLWYLFGRASDLTFLKKQNLSMSGANVLFLRFVRVKTSQENGLSIFPDAGVITCTATDLNLLEPSTESTGASNPKKKPSAPGIHSYDNRLLAKIAKPAGVTSTLTSHSFRRGGAQTANGCPDLTLQWIADHGGWSLSSTNKAFQYIFNTTQEDQKVAKVLSEWDAKAPVAETNLAAFDLLTPDVDTKKKSDSRNVVTFMNLFAGEFALDEASEDFRDEVLALATQITSRVLRQRRRAHAIDGHRTKSLFASCTVT
ncbi:hypothetical protein P43SY_007639 [Pythium insidiosum]|uniref:Uncharacterized protein n=1 Tax=Pythium insidiosum TaxID=114742 RepID=A0AAD5LV98_PYTIN|nr:hypothetical protein P43SY_007639 [Pythium insidiosum]